MKITPDLIDALNQLYEEIQPERQALAQRIAEEIEYAILHSNDDSQEEQP